MNDMKGISQSPGNCQVAQRTNCLRTGSQKRGDHLADSPRVEIGHGDIDDISCFAKDIHQRVGFFVAIRKDKHDISHFVVVQNHFDQWARSFIHPLDIVDEENNRMSSRRHGMQKGFAGNLELD